MSTQTEFDPEIIEAGELGVNNSLYGENGRSFVVQQVNAEEAKILERNGILVNSVEGSTSKRSEGAKKAWATRNAKKQAGNKQVQQAGGITSEQAGWFKTYPQRLAEKREEYAAIERELLEMEALWANAIDGLTVK